jgi:ketol-acid reductoisomerase
MRQNFFNTLTFAQKLKELGSCRMMDASEFSGVARLRDKRIVIVGCGAQGLNQGLNLRDSGLNVAYALRQEAIENRGPSYMRAVEHHFEVGTCDKLVPTADIVANLTPDRQHSAVVETVMPLMKTGATLLYAHGFNIVEEGMRIRDDITVIMVAPKSPGSEVRAEYVRGFGVPALIAVHRENDPGNGGIETAKAYCCGLGCDRAGVLESSFVAEVKSDLMGEQTILCGIQQTASILCYDRMIAGGIDPSYAATLVQYGWETITDALKQGGITLMLNRMSNPARVRACELADTLKDILRPLFEKHMEQILTGDFSAAMMADWANNDADLLRWRSETARTPFENSRSDDKDSIPEQDYFENGILMVAFIRAGVELAFEAMTAAGIYPESAYYEALHETPLIANTIARKKLKEMNVTISDTAEYGNYLFSNACIPLLRDFMTTVDTTVIGNGLSSGESAVDNHTLSGINDSLRSHPIEVTGCMLRHRMRLVNPA